MELKSNWSFVIKVFLPIAIFLGIACIGYAISIVFEGMKISDIVLLLVYCFIELCMVIPILIVIFYKFPIYKFDNEKICKYNKENLVKTIMIEDIQTIHYYPFKWHYFITIFAGALREGGVWKLHITFKNGEKTTLGVFAVKDVKKLKNELYNDLIVIF